MRIKILFVVLLLAVTVPLASAHDEARPVIIDSDASLDDLRAIILLLQNDNYDLKALVTSDGGSSPRIGVEGLNAVLWKLGRESIVLGYGPDSDQPTPPWRGFTEAMWQSLIDQNSRQDFPQAGMVLSSIIDRSEEKIIYICLGPMTNLAQLLEENKSAHNKIGRIYYRGFPPSEESSSWNTGRDKKAVQKVMGYNIPIYFYSPDPAQELSFDTTLFRHIEAINTPSAELIVQTHSQNPINQILQSGHFGAWDESLILSVMYPHLAAYVKSDSLENIYHCTDFDKISAFKLYLELLNRGGNTSLQSRPSVIYQEFPAAHDLYKSDVRQIADHVIELYGRGEWDAAVLTCELHRHLGIYSIIGAKMGIYARELLNASLDQLQVFSYAGNEPPLSCFNDGLQTATGATLGHGTIAIDTSNPRLEVVFTNSNDTVQLRLKDEIGTVVETAIKEALEKHGGLNQDYFDEVRKLALKFWKELDRQSIFQIVKQ